MDANVAGTAGATNFLVIICLLKTIIIVVRLLLLRDSNECIFYIHYS